MEHSLSSASNKSGDARGVAVRCIDFDGVACGVIAAHVVGAAGAVGGSAEGKDDHADRTAGRAEDAIVGGGDAIGVVDQILRILQRLLAQGGIDVNGHPSAGAGSDEFGRSGIAGPCGVAECIVLVATGFLVSVWGGLMR